MPTTPAPAHPIFLLAPPARVFVPPPRSQEQVVADMEAAARREEECRNSPSNACEWSGACTFVFMLFCVLGALVLCRPRS